MIYLDTSFLIPYFVPEQESDAVEAAMSKLRQDVSISSWTEVEFVSALARKVRSRECSEATMRRMVARLKTMITESFVHLVPTATDFEQAMTFMLDVRTGLRAGDALQLAIARRHDATVWSLDKSLLDAARVLKIPAKGL